IGGEVVAPDMGCGVVSSGSSLYFSKVLVSWDLDTEWAEFVQFYLRVGGDWAECNQADSREEGVLLQYSNDGGISWDRNHFVHYELPLASKTPSTRFRWWQPISGGQIGGGCGIISEGKALYFSSAGRREARTAPLDTTNTRTTMLFRTSQFFLRLGCGKAAPDPRSQPVLLQFSVDGGLTWGLACCTGLCRFTPQCFYVLPSEARVKGVMLRWWQPRHDGAGHDQWALDHVEVVLTRKQNYMMSFARQTGMRHYYSRKRRALQQQRA
uniref:Reelin n=1 Tax=Xiphophorus couchianus TaxID=32473 RepID=A0A3B5ML58_9TELE